MPTWIAKNDLWAIAETGYTSKQVQTGMGEVGIHTPRDRDSRFEPEFIKKRERVLPDSVSDRIIGLYALGNSSHARYAALEELVYPAYRNIGKKWTTPLSNWGQTAQQLAITFPDRFKLFE